MKTAKVIRHRHKTYHFINEDIKSVSEETHFKIVFSDPDEMGRFVLWVKEYGGLYDFDKETQIQKGELPTLKKFENMDICWCDIMTYYLLELVKYTFHSTLSPYKGEVYIKDNSTISEK